MNNNVISENAHSSDRQIRLFRCAAMVCLLAISACTTTPATVKNPSMSPAGTAAPASTPIENCEQDCEEDGVSRYKYYLGILSVLLMG